MTGLRSSQVADAAGVNLQTLRYYERRGLLAEPDRSLGGHRLYPAEAVTVLKVIKAAQRLGFTLDEVADLLAVGGHRRRGADAGLARRARSKLAEVDASGHRVDAARGGGCGLRRPGGLRWAAVLPDPVRPDRRRRSRCRRRLTGSGGCCRPV